MDATIATADIVAAVDDALNAQVPNATARRMTAVTIARAVVAARQAHNTYMLDLLASDVPTSQRGELVHRLYTDDMRKSVLPNVLEVGVKAAALALLLAEVGLPTSSAKAAGATVKTPAAIAALGLTKIECGKYRHQSGAVIERRPPGRVGRNGFAYAGWAVVVDGREINRWSTLATAADRETARTA